jgi:hypothetical protein
VQVLEYQDSLAQYSAAAEEVDAAAAAGGAFSPGASPLGGGGGSSSSETKRTEELEQESRSRDIEYKGEAILLYLALCLVALIFVRS